MDGGGCCLLASQGTVAGEGGGRNLLCSKAKTERGLTAEPGTVRDEPDQRGASSGDLESV